jgi:3-carboxy-cis,cis-muconate cycloisomerase
VTPIKADSPVDRPPRYNAARMPARLIEALATTEPLADLFSDESVLRAMLQFEVALANAQAHVGVIPRSAARAIAAAQIRAFDVSTLAHDILRAGTPAIPFVKALTQFVRRKDATAAGFVHWGATSQDLADTALVLLLKQALPILAKDLTALESSLRALSEKHKNTVMLGRTLLQPAPPITFGLKAANWLSSVRRSREKLESTFAEALVLQFGGASGTLASLGKNGPAVAHALAKEVGLDCPEAPWHTQRDRLASLICACGVLTGSLGKMARDIALMMQNEIAEVAEPAGGGRGGSSTMPHKRNPIACALTLAAANRLPNLVASFLSAMSQEHERGVGGWQAEWPTVAAVIQSTGVAAASMAEAASGLWVDPKRMRANLEATNGLIFAERAMMLLAPKTGRDAAHQILESAASKSVQEGKRIASVLAEMPDATKHLNAATLSRIESPEEYLGSAENFRKAQLVKKPVTKTMRKKER